jgi:hypothetical protein
MGPTGYYIFLPSKRKLRLSPVFTAISKIGICLTKDMILEGKIAVKIDV